MANEYKNRAYAAPTQDEDYVDVDVEINNGKEVPRAQTKIKTPDEDELRRKLKFFLANPCQRWFMDGASLYARIPIKLIIQMLKIVFVTTQLLIVGQERSRYGNYLDRSNKALNNLFLKSWITQYETMPYPPASGVYGIYHIEDLYSHINFAVKQFREIPTIAMGSYYFVQRNGTAVPMELCIKYYKTRQFYPNGTLILDTDSLTDCFSTSSNYTKAVDSAYAINSTYNSTNSTTSSNTEEYKEYDVKEHLAYENFTQNMDRMLEIKLKFLFNSIRLDTTIANSEPDCFSHEGEIIFDNTDRNGQLLVDMSVIVSEFPCTGSYPRSETKFTRDVGLAVAVILLSLLSLFFCFGSIRSTVFLLMETKRYFRVHLRKNLQLSDQTRFIKHWDILTIINDILTVLGTCFRLVVEQNRSSNLSSNYDVATSLLGLGCLFVWFGILRYFSFFPKFYILFLTLNKAIHSILRYMLCVVIIYAGFVFCGWAVLGPYHLKFKTLQSTGECLFATINGDELFVTLAGFTVAKDEFIWWFSRFYMFTYIGLFTAIAINLFIAILTDTYETIKQYCKHGFPMTELLEFIYADEIYSPLAKACNYNSICCCSREVEDDIYEN